MKRVVYLAACVVLFTGCQQPMTRLNAPPHGTAQRVSPLQDTLAQMVDNALLEDMTISDIHFDPHRATLNSLGRERLSRLAGLIEVHGGTVRLNTDADEKLSGERIAAATQFLAQHGVNTTTPVVTVDLPGGRGMDAEQALAMQALERVRSTTPKKDGARDAQVR